MSVETHQNYVTEEQLNTKFIKCFFSTTFETLFPKTGLILQAALSAMTKGSVVEDLAPLQTQHIPSAFIDRDNEQEELEDLISEDSSQNLFLHGAKGTGKTHLTLYQLNQLPETVNTCYIPCRRCNTQYKALKQLYEAVTDDEISSGHHTSALQRKIKERTSQTQTVAVLDDIEFLLMNDGDSLLYNLSRTNTQNLALVLISSQHTTLTEQLEERTYSSLHPYRIEFKPYTAEEIFEILSQRSKDSLKPRSVHRQALTYIASTTQNAGAALTWLHTAAQNSGDQITEQTVSKTRESAYQNYAEKQLRYFSQHHQLLHQAIQELEEEHGAPVNTGKIYTRYQDLCQAYSEEPVSNRRVSTYLKHLELLELIQADYHYGGKTGKTREVELDRL